MAQRSPSIRPLMFAYWGRCGAMPEFTLALARVAAARNDVRCAISVSRQNEQFRKFEFLNDDLHSVDTFDNGYGAVLRCGSVLDLRKRLTQRLASDGTRAIVTLMPHVWSPLITPVIRRAGVRHLVIIHDAASHPGDWSGIANRWLLHEAGAADHVITLSKSVARQLTTDRGIPENKISVIFHPDYSYGDSCRAGTEQPGPLRVLFLGRILPYKGLGLFADAMARLRRDGVPLQVGVFGEGRIEPATAATLSGLGAEIENRWIDHDAFRGILARYDVLAASHIEASQSGVVAAAFGAGLPVVATPVGGLVEQVNDGVTGAVAEKVTPSAFGDAIRRVAENPDLLARLRFGVASLRKERSMERFFERISEIALRGPNV